MDEDSIMVVYFIGFFILIVVVFFLIVWLGRKENKQDEAMKEKISELRKRGQDLHVNRTEPLSNEDIQHLEKYSRMSATAVTIVFIAIAGIFAVVGNWIFYLLGAGLLVLIIPARK
ncbi:MAG: hypothetical protein MUE95_08760, partial [Cyclobacteriaceae bacterium]|nr:hypothetical protein [Cyclobacteriaceae bacterium]